MGNEGIGITSFAVGWGGGGCAECGGERLWESGQNEKALNPNSFWLISVDKKSFFFYD